MYNGIQSFVIYDPATGDTVEIYDLDANGTFFEQSEVGAGETGPTGVDRRRSQRSFFTAGFLASSAGSEIGQLRSWMESGTRVSMVALGPDQAVQWYETDRLVLKKRPFTAPVRGRGDVFDVSMERVGHGRHTIAQQANLLAHLGWNDPEATLAVGYTKEGSGTALFNSGVQELFSDTPGDGIYYDLVFPFRNARSFPGQSVTLSVDIEKLHTDTSSANIRIEAKNFAGSTLATSTNDVSATGRDDVSRVFNPSILTYSYRIWVLRVPTGVTGNADIEVKDPAVHVNGDTTYREY